MTTGRGADAPGDVARLGDVPRATPGPERDPSTRTTPTPSWSPERLFGSIALCFGFLFVFVVPPIQMADEDSHYKKALAVSMGDVLPHAVVDGAGARFGSTLPRSAVEFVEQHRYLTGRPDAKYRYQELYARTAAPVDGGGRVFDVYSAAALDPLVYLPSAAGIAAGRLLYSIGRVSPLYTPAAQLLFGRLFNLAFFIACVCWAIRLTPVAKEAFAAAALLPMTMALAASVNRDAVVNAVAFLFVAFVLHLARRDAPVARRDRLALFALAFALLVGKQVYFAIAALLLVIPAARWGPGRAKLRTIAAIVLGCLALAGVEAAWLAFVSRGPVSAEGAAARQQLQYVLQHPGQTLSLLLSAPWDNRVGWLVGLIGNLGWLDTNFPYPLLVVCGLVVVAAALFDRAGAGLDAPGKLLAVGIVVAATLAMELFFYLAWVSLPRELGVGARGITGIQGRYFLPLLPLVLLVLRNDLTARWERVGALVRLALPPLLVAFQLATLWALLLRYWIPVPPG